jgi:hypothetical protein
MIHFALQCPLEHRFDSWFASNAVFDAQLAAAQVSCPICGNTGVRKSLMAPNVQTASLRSAPTAAESALSEMRRAVTEHSDYVGLNFAAEARKMHSGEIDSRAIYGEAKIDEARALIQDGMPVMPLPFMVKTN